MPFEFKQLAVPGVILVVPKVFGDARGFFLEFYKHSEFAQAGIPEHFVQDNHSKSVKGVLRGLHYQKAPHAQGKLVRCLHGKIFDVAVDIRKGSPNYGKWAGAELSGENNHMLYVPPGFAHGFLVLSEQAEVLYKCTEEYAPAGDRGVVWNDPDIGIVWPLTDIILSEKDKLLPQLKKADNNFTF
jgi:dTDP-4-dehydrorhamnose 3,5-epimerase